MLKDFLKKFCRKYKIYYFCQSKPNQERKIMKKFYLFLGLILIYSLLSIAMNNKISKERLEGKWNVKVTNAPGGYQDYVIDINENDGEYKADIFFVEANSKMFNQKLMLKDGKLTGDVVVDNEKVELTIWEEKGVVQGTAKSYSIGTLLMTFTRSKN